MKGSVNHVSLRLRNLFLRPETRCVRYLLRYALPGHRQARERHGLAQEVALEAFRRMWVEDVDINAPEQLAAIARAAVLL